MRRSDDRPDPWSPFALRPVFRLLVGTLAIGFLVLMVYAYRSSRSRHAFMLPVDTQSREPAAFGIYVVNKGYSRVNPTTGQAEHVSMFNQNWPNALVVAAWDDGRVAWSIGKEPELAETVSSFAPSSVIATARTRLIEALNDRALPNEPPWVTTGDVWIHLFVRDGERHRTITAQPWEVEHETPDHKPEAALMLDLAGFRAKWAAFESIMNGVIPKSAERTSTDWLAFQPDRN